VPRAAILRDRASPRWSRHNEAVYP
jgi:hypothetical protein